jgi:hypothetical protein
MDDRGRGPDSGYSFAWQQRAANTPSSTKNMSLSISRDYRYQYDIPMWGGRTRSHTDPVSDLLLAPQSAKVHR